MNRNILFAAIAVIVIAGGAYYFINYSGVEAPLVNDEQNGGETTTPQTGNTSTKPSTPAKGQTSATPATAVPSKTAGRVVFTIADEAVGLDTLQSLVTTLNEVSVSGPSGWVTIVKTPRAFDLLDLYKTGKNQLLADVNLAPGTYNQLRVSLGSVIVVQKEGLKSTEARVPSKQLRMNIKLVVEKGGTSALSLDILSDKALHRAGDGTFIFFPTVKVATQHKVGKVQIVGTNTEILNGASDFDQTFGVDHNGTLKNGFSLLAATRIELIGTVIRLIPSDEKQDETKENAQKAIDAARAGGYIDTVLSVQTTTRNGVRVWHVAGLKNGVLVNVYSTITTGAVIASE